MRAIITLLTISFISTCFASSAVASDTTLAVAEAAFADGDFAAAEHGYNDVLAKTPDDGAALAALARIRLYQERRVEAREIASRALGADPTNALAKRVLAGVAARDASFGPDVYRIDMPKSGSRIGFVTTDPLPIVKVRVNGARSAYFLIDTGAPDLVLDETFAKELGLELSAAGQGTFAGGQHAAIAHSRLSRIDLGAVRVDGVPVTLLPTRDFALKPGIQIDGIVGTGFLQHFLSTIDYVSGALILRPRSQSAAFLASLERHGGTSIPMWLTGDHFIFARGHINDGPEALFSIDTGLAGGGLQGTKATLDASHVTLDESHSRTEPGPGGIVRIIPFKASASLGQITVDNVDGIFTPDGDQFGIFPFRVAGTLSHAFFRAHALTFDFVAMRLVIS